MRELRKEWKENRKALLHTGLIEKQSARGKPYKKILPLAA
jgi:hypothetical protein